MIETESTLAGEILRLLKAAKSVKRNPELRNAAELAFVPLSLRDPGQYDSVSNLFRNRNVDQGDLQRRGLGFASKSL
jgi:hypothetical protein